MKDNNLIFEKILNDIENSISSQNYYAALALALTIPDICGKAEYPCCKSSKFRYVAWYDINVGYYERAPFGDCKDCPEMNSYLDNFSDIYQTIVAEPKLKVMPSESYPFPCHECTKEHSVMQNGSAIYDLRCSFLHSGNPGLESDKDIPSFSLMIGEADWCDSAGKQSYEVHVKRLCKILMLTGRGYYKDNQDKFNFFHFTTIDVDERERKFEQLRNLNRGIAESTNEI